MRNRRNRPAGVAHGATTALLARGRARSRPLRGRAQTRGFSLLEVLVALVVLSIGLLGIAGLQVTALRSTHGAYVRSQAVLLAYDMADRMRGNRLAVTDLAGNDVGFYDSAGGNYVGAANGNCAETPSLSTPTPCNITNMARHDIFEWNAALATQLPSGTGTVCIDDVDTADSPTAAAPSCTAGGTPAYVIKVFWKEIEEEGPQDKFFTLPFRQ